MNPFLIVLVWASVGPLSLNAMRANQSDVSADPTRVAPPKHVPVPIEQSQQRTDNLGIYAKLVGGVWDSNTEWKGGPGTHNPLHARVSYHWMAGGTVIRVVSNVVSKDGKEKLAYESVCFWHPTEERVKFFSFGTGGNLFEGTSSFSGDEVSHTWTSHDNGAAVEYKESITLTDPDHYRWIVYRKDGERWVQIMDSVYARER